MLPISARLSLTLLVGTGLPCLGRVELMGTRVCAIDGGAKLPRDANWSQPRYLTGHDQDAPAREKMTTE